MAIKNILVHVDKTDSGAQRLNLSVSMAKQQGAHLRLLIVDRAAGLSTFEGYADEVKAYFEGRIAGISSEWIVIDSKKKAQDTVDQVIWYAKHADLVVVGQSHSNSSSRALIQIEERLMLEGGRPVLVVPYVGSGAGISRVMVAWNGSRESVRAVNDAIPLMQAADSVILLALLNKNQDHAHENVSCEEIIKKLEMHGIKAEILCLTVQDINAGNVLLSCLADESIDLLVMGGYGHHRFRELVLGGVTREILAHMTVPVLLSH
jgi:nucleotide-binding universal stress UspA family protein